jgi:hypothetical protein
MGQLPNDEVYLQDQKTQRIRNLEAEVERLRGQSGEHHEDCSYNDDGTYSCVHGCPVGGYVHTLEAEVERLTGENKELNDLFDMQHTRTKEADKMWQEATGKRGTLPDLGTLIEWLLDQLSTLRAQQRELREALHALISTHPCSHQSTDLVTRRLAGGLDEAERKSLNSLLAGRWVLVRTDSTALADEGSSEPAPAPPEEPSDKLCPSCNGKKFVIARGSPYGCPACKGYGRVGAAMKEERDA